MQKEKIKDKKLQKNVEHWMQLYLQAKTIGDTTRMKMYGAIILRLGAALPK